MQESVFVFVCFTSADKSRAGGGVQPNGVVTQGIELTKPLLEAAVEERRREKKTTLHLHILVLIREAMVQRGRAQRSPVAESLQY